MLPDRVSNPGPLIYESGALPTALRGPAACMVKECLVLCVIARSMQSLFQHYLNIHQIFL